MNRSGSGAAYTLFFNTAMLVLLCILAGYNQYPAHARTGGPDAFGYRFIDSNEPGGPVYNFEDISGTGTQVSLSDDSRSPLINIGFNFEFYGVERDELHIFSDCLLAFEGVSHPSQACCSGQVLPTPDSYNYLIAGWWEDINPGVGGAVHYQTLGSAPNRRFIVQFTATPLFGAADTITMQFKLFEADDTIEVHYQQTVTDSNRYSAGIENIDGTDGLQYYYGGDPLPTPLAVAYINKPKVVSILPADLNPTSKSLVNYEVNFSEGVTGVDLTDFVLDGTMTSPSLVSVTEQTASTYLVAVNTGPGEGELRLDLIDDDTISDTAEGEPLGGLGLVNGDYTSGSPYTIDRTGPEISGITRVGPNPATSLPVDFLVQFNEPVDQVDVNDFEVVTTGPLTNIALIPGSRAFGDALNLLNNPETTARCVTVADAPSLRLTNLTLEAWVYYQNDGPEIILGKGTDYALAINNSGGQRLNAYIGGWRNSTSTIPTNTWTHVAVTYDGSNIRFYIDGALDNTIAYAGALGQTATGLAVGCISASSQTNAFDGFIDEARVWNFARTQTEIQETINTTLAGAQTGLAAYWRFDETVDLGIGGDSQSDDFEDFSGNNNHGDSVNGPVELITSNFFGLAPAYRIRVDGDGGEGSIELVLRDNDTIKDAARNEYGGAGAQDYTDGEIFGLDTVAPSVDHIQVLDLTTLDITFNETFGMDAQAQVAANYTLSGAGQGTLAANPDTVTQQAPNIYRLGWSSGSLLISGDVTVTAANMQDTTGFNLVAPFSATDERSNPVLTSVTPSTTGPTNADEIVFIVEFDKNVINFDDPADVTITHNGTASTGVSFEVTYLPRIIEVTVSGITGNGWFTLGVAAGVAEDSQGNLSLGSITSAQVNIDNISPVVDVTTLTTGDNRPALEGNVDDNSAALSLTVGGQTVSPTNDGDGTWSLADDVLAVIADGTYDIQISATDPAGNVGSDATNNELVIDTQAPTVTVNTLETNDNTPTITGSYSDASTTVVAVVVDVDGTTYTTSLNSGTWSVTLPVTADGTYEVVATATDAAGNDGTDATNNELTIDATMPVLVFDAFATSLTQPLFAGTASDAGSGVDTVELTVNAQSFFASYNSGDWSGTPAAALPQGVFNVDFSVLDHYGNELTTTTLAGVTVDLTTPTVTIDPLITNLSEPTITGTVEDAFGIVDAVSVDVDGTLYAATINGNAWSIQTNTLAEGNYEVAATVRDRVGNIGMDTSTMELSIDLTTPTVTISPLLSDDNTPLLTGTYADGFGTVERVVVEIDGTSITATLAGGDWEAQVAAALADGLYPVTLTVVDEAGNQTQTTVPDVIDIDTTPPVVTVNTLFTQDTLPTVSGTVSDVHAISQLRVNVEGIWYPGNLLGNNWTADITTTLTQGFYDVVAEATDLAGQVGLDATSDELVIDNTLPIVNVDTLITSDTMPLLTGTAFDLITSVTQVVVAVDGTTVTAQFSGDVWQAAWPVGLSEGTYDVITTATDFLGAEGVDATIDELIIDTTVPTPAISGPGQEIIQTGTLVYQINYGETLSVLPTLDALSLSVTGTVDVTPSLEAGADASTVTLVIADGDGTVALQMLSGSGKDLAGNPAAASALSSLVTVDNTAPTVSITPLSNFVSAADQIRFLVELSEPLASPLTLANVDLSGSLATQASAFVFQDTPTQYLIDIIPDDLNANGTLGISISGVLSDLAGNLANVPVASQLITLRHQGSVNISVTPETAPWTLTDSSGANVTGTGSQTVSDVITGPATVTWEPLAGYNQPDPTTLSLVVPLGAQVSVIGLYQAIIPESETESATILEYLLGLKTNPEGLDVNGDGAIDIADYRTQIIRDAPEVPSNPVPSDFVSDLGSSVTLSWTGGPKSFTYDLYLWSVEDPFPSEPTATGLEDAQFTTELAPDTIYAWKVVAHNTVNFTAGPVWNFTTAEALRLHSQTADETYSAGDSIDVDWESLVVFAGYSVFIELWQDGSKVADLGISFVPDFDPEQAYCGKTETLILPESLEPGTGYNIRIVSAWLADRAPELAWLDSLGTITIVE